MVNDVSGGTFDADMLNTVSELDVPIVIMHMRGTPETMQSLAVYKDVVEEVSRELAQQAMLASLSYNIPRWVQILDPGIGFAKDLRGNLLLLKNIASIRRIAENVPILLGTSRKGFIGKISGEDIADNRDPGTIASYVAALCLEHNQLGCNILRVHNVADCKQAIQVMDAIRDS
jgi:dihydropteroate synthase